MQQILTSPDPDTDYSHILHVELPEIDGREALAEHVDRYVQLYLQAFPPLKARHVRLAAARFGLDAEEMSSAALDAVREDLAGRLFPESEAWRVRLDREPGMGETVYQPAGGGLDGFADEADAESWDDGAETDIAAELARFRQDMAGIAGTLSSHTELRDSVEAFRSELGELSEAFCERVTHAAHTIEDAAQRVEASAALMPDPDRFELVLTRNEASAAILERGVRQSLSLLLQAVETMAERGALPARTRLAAPAGEAGHEAGDEG